MSLCDQIVQAAPKFEAVELDLFGQKFPLRVRLVSMADFNTRMKKIGENSAASMAAEMAEWFFTSDGEKAFAPEDFAKLPARAVKRLMEVFAKVNTGSDEKNG